VGMEFVVSPDGVATNDGSEASPWGWPPPADLDKRLNPGDVLLLRGGTYVTTATVTGLKAPPGNPIVIRSFPGEHAVLDGATIGEFRVVPNESWEPVGDGEFRSRTTFVRSENTDERARGSFLERVPRYTRLISYSRIQDLRADNQLFGELPPGSTLDGFEPLDHEPRRPWVYMGPGLFHAGPAGPDVLDDDVGPGHIHIRLSVVRHECEQWGYPMRRVSYMKGGQVACARRGGGKTTPRLTVVGCASSLSPAVRPGRMRADRSLDRAAGTRVRSLRARPASRWRRPGRLAAVV
jgi:hypothetical protein